VQRLLADSTMRLRLLRELGSQDPDRKELEHLALQKLIIRGLFLQEAAQRHLTVTEQELDGAFTKFRSRFKNAKRFAAWKKAQGLDDKRLREDLHAQMLVRLARKAVAEEARLTEEQVQEYYEAHKEEWKRAEEVRLRVIAVRDKAAADELLAALKHGEDFDRLARERSVGDGAAQGGDLGWVRTQRLQSPLQEAVRSLKAGETSGPLQSGAEFIVVRVEERQPGRTVRLAEARPEIERRLLPAKQQEAVEAWLMEQAQQAQIEVLLNARKGL
jgi:parvulin-like peptidyl-prolyl isomerase